MEEADRAPKGTTILFWDYQAATRDDAGRTYVADPEGERILVLSPELRPIAWRRPTGRRGERLVRPVLLSAWRNDTLVAFEASGGIVLFDLWGRAFTRLDGPFPIHVGAVAPGRHLVLARSPVLFPFNFVASGDPLLATLDLRAAQATGVDTVIPPPADYWYAGIAANAGMVAVESAGAFYFAWLVRPEIRKYDAAGRLLWRSERPVPFPVEVPRLVPQGPGERPKLRLHTVHKGIALGPDGLLYVRAAADTLGQGDRLEVFDPATGAWLRSAALDTGSVVLAGPKGRIWEMARSRFLPAAEPERQRVAEYALATLGGDTLGPRDARGRVLVIAFWASWCAPCREELPLLDTLYRNTSRDALEVHAISEDVDIGDARRFAESLDLSFPLLLGRGEMRERVGYQGLPYTLIVDRRGRVARQLYGFGGRDEFVNRVIPLIRQEMESANP
ncbi:MAG: redoxin domain-containing protein [Gemmatimonadota bacterium]